MNVKMFIYIYGNDINKIIAKYFNVKKISLPKVKSVTLEDGILAANQLGGYCKELNTIFVNSCLWQISSNYDMHALFAHELIHVYQHAYNLCEFDYEVIYSQRPQEIHCSKHCPEVIAMLNVPFESSLIDLIFEEAMA